MRVNVQFSADLEDVPRHVIELLKDADGIIEDEFASKLSDKLEDFIDNKNYVDSISYLASVRDKLMAIDHRLDDCMRILVGYQQVIANPSHSLPQVSSLDQAIDETRALTKSVSSDGEFK